VTIWFVTGTDTGVGKTTVVAAIAAVHIGHNRRVAVVKPAQTGVTAAQAGDVEEVARLAGQVHTVEGVRLPEPVAPDRAAAVAGLRLPALAAQRDLVLDTANSYDSVFVEGSGGVTVNLGISFTLLDIAAEVQAAGRPVEWLVVARSALGTLNHARLTVDAIRDRGMEVRGLVIGSWPDEPTDVDRYNRIDLVAYTGVPVLGAVPADASLLDPPRFRAEASRWLPELAALGRAG
jgi:dethiobiotin synthase